MLICEVRLKVSKLSFTNLRSQDPQYWLELTWFSKQVFSSKYLLFKIVRRVVLQALKFQFGPFPSFFKFHSFHGPRMTSPFQSLHLLAGVITDFCYLTFQLPQVALPSHN
jgi:hypothetical protein